jgi:hypothetical protein
MVYEKTHMQNEQKAMMMTFSFLIHDRFDLHFSNNIESNKISIIIKR